MYIHPGSNQKPVYKPNKTIFDQWAKLHIDWVSVVVAVGGMFLIWALVANQCNNQTKEFLDPICVVLPH